MVDGATVAVTELGDHGARIDLVSGGRIVRLVDVESDGATPAYLFSYSEAGVRGLAETLAVQVDAGGTQVFSSVMPLADTRRYRLALRYRTTGGLLFVRALRREDVTWGVLKGATGEPVSRLFELWSAKGAEPGWQTSANALALRRHVRARYPGHYYDCLRFLQRDTALRTRNEMATVRKAVPGVPVTVDVRGHHAYTDGYMAYDPEAIASLEDIFHVHCGFFAYEYNNTPVHVPTLCDATAYPLFAYNYFVRNTTKPVVQSEDIISRAGLPGSDGEAMAENDMARDSPLTEGVAKVNLFTLSPLVAHKGPDVVPVVRIPETADNAALLENVVGWLLRERVTPEMRATFKANLFVTKEAME